jgi:hypothetical protein
MSRYRLLVLLWLWPTLVTAQRPPDLPAICENCWPTECGPGQWSATGNVPVHKHPDSLLAALSLRAGDTFYVDSSIVRVTRFGRVVMRQRVGEYAPGDTLIITSDVAEGYYGIWWHGQQRNERNLWSGTDSRAHLLTPIRQQWWVHMHRATMKGWIPMAASIPAHNLECP